MRMSRRNTRQSGSAPGPRTGGPRAVEDQAIQPARRPDGSDPQNSDEHGSGLRADAEGGVIAMDLDEVDLDTGADLENVDLDDFGDLDADDADLQAALTVLAVLADDISGVAEVTDELAVDVDVPDGPEGPDEPEPDQSSAEADTEAEGPGAVGARVVKLSPDGGGEDEEIFVFGDDDDDLPAAQVAVAGATADPVKDYLKQIGKVINKLARVQRQMLQDLGREPTPDELAVELDMTPEKVVEVKKYGREPISLHTPLGEDGDSEFGDLIEDTEAVVPADAVGFTMLQKQLESLLDSLSEREAGVIRMRFGLGDGMPKNLDQIGDTFGVTRERIRQIESKTMAKLRHPSRSQSLRDYLE